MITSFMLYWFFTVYKVILFIQTICGIILTITLLTTLISLACWDCIDKNYKNGFIKRKSLIIVTASICVFLLFLTMFLPSKKEVAIIYVLPKIAQNKDIQEIPPNIAKLANEGIKELIDLVKDEAKNIKEK